MPDDKPIKPRRTWTPPAPPPQGRAAAPAAAPLQLQPPAGSLGDYVARALAYALIFGVICALFRSLFPLALGAVLFVADEKFIEWALAKAGVRFVPNSFGLAFIDAFVFFAGAFALAITWKESAPDWLLPPAGTRWLAISLLAFVCAAVKTLSAWVVKKLLTQFGITLTPNGQSAAELGLTGLGLLVCVVVVQWL